MPAIRRTAAAGALAALTLLAAACAPQPGPPESATASAAPVRWKFADWDHWASGHLFHNPVIRDLWDAERMKNAEPQQRTMPQPAPAPSPSATRPAPAPAPAPVAAVPVPRPYTGDPVSGKVFLTAPNGGSGQCSATVIADPARPGQSNLVWTAGHCVHQGKGGDWYKNLIFVPAYNSSGAAGGGRPATLAEVAPFGQWWADQVVTSPQWMAEGGHSGDSANQYDFAILRVHNPADDTKSLEEAIGAAAPVWFDAPRDRLDVSAWGYPAVRPFDGQSLDRCDGGHPSALSFDATRPPMLTIGCTMTEGASGGGWFARMPDGRTALVSNTSLGTPDHTTLSGPYLDAEAKQLLDYFDRK